MKLLQQFVVLTQFGISALYVFEIRDFVKIPSNFIKEELVIYRFIYSFVRILSVIVCHWEQ